MLGYVLAERKHRATPFFTCSPDMFGDRNKGGYIALDDCSHLTITQAAKLPVHLLQFII
jgi:hypothetical protein